VPPRSTWMFRLYPVASKGFDRFVRGPSVYVHERLFARKSLKSRLRAGVEDDPERDRWLAGRYAWCRFWRVVTPPSAGLPARAARSSHGRSWAACSGLNTVIGQTGRRDILLELLAVKYDPGHRWHYLSDMTEDDMLVFIGSESISEIPGIFPHQLRQSLEPSRNPRPRISCETRAVVY